MKKMSYAIASRVIFDVKVIRFIQDDIKIRTLYTHTHICCTVNNLDSLVLYKNIKFKYLNRLIKIKIVLQARHRRNNLYRMYPV